MKKIILLLFLLSFFVIANAQCWQSVSAGDSYGRGESYSIGIKSDGSLYSWGNDGGLACAGIFTYPSEISYGNWRTISAGGPNRLGIKSDGTLWLIGQPGTCEPLQLNSDNDWQQISVGEANFQAIKNDGTLWGWGSWGYDGIGDSIEENLPIQIGVENNWHSLVSGQFHSLAIKTDGTLWGWGINSSNQLGDGTDTDRIVPEQIGIDNDWMVVSAGAWHSLGIKNDGTLWAWGDNSYGKLGDGTTTHKIIPTQIGTDNDWKSISAGYFFSLAIKNNGTLWAWGNNGNGELGDGTTVDKKIPTQIGLDNIWASISAGMDHSLGIMTDNTLWAWGHNNWGQLGYGKVGDPSYADTSVPAQIGCVLVLPVTLLSFTAQKQLETTLLNWQTATEQNNKEYQIERSGDGNTFKEIASTQSKNSISGSRYSYVDTHPLSGNNYYRLKSVDIDGKFSYSNIDKVTFNLNANNVIVYPNPAKDILTVQSNFKGEKLNITITDLAGRKILQIIKQNNPLIEIPISDFRAGFYLLKINDGITSVNKKILKE